MPQLCHSAEIQSSILVGFHLLISGTPLQAAASGVENVTVEKSSTF